MSAGERFRIDLEARLRKPMPQIEHEYLGQLLPPGVTSA